MKITETRQIEQRIVKLFNESTYQDNQNKKVDAQSIVKKILEVFEFISIFNNYNHLEIVKKLYFNKNNIEVLGVRRMALKLYMDEKTLYKLRAKYCVVICEVLKSLGFII